VPPGNPHDRGVGSPKGQLRQLSAPPFIPTGPDSSRNQHGFEDESDGIYDVASRRVRAPQNIDWLIFNPIAKGFISYTDVIRGGLTLFDLYKMNEVISYESELEREIGRISASRMRRKK
jgi:hypothetical protein